MGQTLSEPITSKETSCLMNDHYKVGSSCMQGWRTHMEDSHCHILSLPDDPEAAFFGVYDGHGGNNIAKYSSKHLHKYILKRPEYKTNIEEAIIKGFLDLDYVMLTDDSLKDQMAGSTAVTALIKDNKLYCGNCGDSRAIGCKNGSVVVLSNDHKPMNPEESTRIYNAGGWVEFNRVNGNLALSRALGDYIFKRNDEKSAEEQIVTALPEVMTFDLSEEWEFVVLACDGIWDVLSNQEVVDFVVKCIAEGKYPEDICEELLSYCLAPVCQMGGLGGDNMTLIIVCLLHGQPYENLIERCKKLHAEREKKRNEFFNGVNGEGSKENVHERPTITPLSVESLMNAYFAQGGPSSFQTVGRSAVQSVESTSEPKISSSSSSATSSPTSCASSTSPENCDSSTVKQDEDKLEPSVDKMELNEAKPKEISEQVEQNVEKTPEKLPSSSEKDVKKDETKQQEIPEIKIQETEPQTSSSDDNKNVSEQ